MSNALILNEGTRHIGDGGLLVVIVNGVVLARRIRACISARARRMGLLGNQHIGLDDGVLLFMPKSRRGKSGPATAIHTIGMRFAISVAWINAGQLVVHSELARPWLPYVASPQAADYILEVSPDHLGQLEPGVQVEWSLSKPNDDV